MFGKALALLALVGSAFCGSVQYHSSYPVGSQSYAAGSSHVGLQSEQTIRGYAGSSISHQQKAVDSPFSSVRKTDTRVTNPTHYTAAVAAAPVYHAPAVYQQTYAAAPVKAVAAAPVYQHAYAAPAYQHGYAAPAPVYSRAYAAPVKAAVAAAPLVAKTHSVGYATPAVAKVSSPLLGVQYSAVSPAVATLNFNGYGISYGY